MKLIPYREKIPQKYISNDPICLDCKSRNEMWETYSTISNWCKQESDNSVIVWTYKCSQNLICLWFEEEKIKMLFELMK